MANNVAPTYAKADVKSGLENEAYAEKVLDGIPAKKTVEEIEAVNTPKKAPGSVRK
jgi:hypothetical protein